MSRSRILVSLSNVDGDPLVPTAVIFSDVLNTYGVLDIAAHEIVVPHGIEFDQLSPGTYEYQIGLTHGRIYRYALKILIDTRAFYLRGYLCPAAQEQLDIGFSLSESDSESAPEPVSLERSVQLFREDSIRRFVFGQANSHRMRVRVLASANMTRFILGHEQRIIASAGDTIEQFAMIVSPVDVTAYPINEPDIDQTPGYYRRDYIDIILPNPDVADLVWARMKTEIDNLVATYRRLDILEA